MVDDGKIGDYGKLKELLGALVLSLNVDVLTTYGFSMRYYVLRLYPLPHPVQFLTS